MATEGENYEPDGVVFVPGYAPVANLAPEQDLWIPPFPAPETTWPEITEPWDAVLDDDKPRTAIPAIAGIPIVNPDPLGLVHAADRQARP
jgi:hypothetical protein